MSETKGDLRGELSRWKGALQDRGLNISRSNTEYLPFNAVDGGDDRSIDGEAIKRVTALIPISWIACNYER